MVENKLDLSERNWNDSCLESFAQRNEFCGCFKTSAKTGYNISESMEFLIKNIIKRMKGMTGDVSKIKKKPVDEKAYNFLKSLNKFLKY